MFDFIKKRGDQIEIGNWYIGWHSWKFEMVYQECGYERGNAELHISMLGWHSVLFFLGRAKGFQTAIVMNRGGESLRIVKHCGFIGAVRETGRSQEKDI